MERKIVVLGSWINEEHKRKIRMTAEQSGFTSSFFGDENEAKEAGALFDAEVVFGQALQAAAFSKALKWICIPSAGADMYMKPGALRSEELVLTNSSGAYGATLAEHMVMQTLMLVRRMPEFEEGIRNRVFLPPREQTSVKDSRVTVLGAGDIGQCYARRIRAFEPKRIVAVNRSGKSAEEAFDSVIPWTELDRILPETDILAMSLPGTPETAGILSEHRIALLPETAYVINVGRGSAIDEAALVKALNEGRLAGAALDVMQHEPLPADDPLWEARNVILTPHVAGNMTIAYTKNKAVEMFCEDLENYAAGRPMRHIVNRKLGY